MTVLDALFPVSKPEQVLFSYSPEQALNKLPPASKPPIAGTYSIFAYKDKRVTWLVWQIKYMKSAKAVSIGGYALYQTLQRLNLYKPPKQGRFLKEIILVPIPITPKRRRERGFNQCELLLDELSRLDREKRFILKSELITRIHHTTRQTLKNRSDRLESAKNIFAVNEKSAEELKYMDLSPVIIVIDDVITTGSTMKEAIDTLKRSGFNDVYGLSLAH